MATDYPLVIKYYLLHEQIQGDVRRNRRRPPERLWLRTGTSSCWFVDNYRRHDSKEEQHSITNFVNWLKWPLFTISLSLWVCTYFRLWNCTAALPPHLTIPGNSMRHVFLAKRIILQHLCTGTTKSTGFNLMTTLIISQNARTLVDLSNAILIQNRFAWSGSLIGRMIQWNHWLIWILSCRWRRRQFNNWFVIIFSKTTSIKICTRDNYPSEDQVAKKLPRKLRVNL